MDGGKSQDWVPAVVTQREGNWIEVRDEDDRLAGNIITY